MTDVTREDWIKADETCVALLPSMPFDTDLGAFRESLAASFAAHRIAAEQAQADTIASLRAELAEARRKGMMEAAGIAMTHFPGSAGYEPYMAAGHAISKAIRQRATAIETAGADHDR